MNEKVLKTLEFYKIKERLEEYAASQTAKELCRALVPSSDIEEIQKQQKQTSDALQRLIRKGSLSFAGIKDIRPSLKRLSVGASLGIGELLAISSLLDTASRVKSFARNKDVELEPDSLDEMFDSLEPLYSLNYELKRCIVSEEEISDEASPNLKSIRRTIKNTNEKIRSQLSSMINNQNTRTYLQENVITMRNGRYCIPVKQEYRGQVAGMIHDQSSTGSTLFVEPMAVVKLNNDIKELMIKEQEEIEKILSILSNTAALNQTELEDNFHILTTLDFIFAKANLSRSYHGSEPIFNDKGIIFLKDARHPLLNPKTVVPSNIHLGDDFYLLIVTGPNTGGKTVSLKTVGLLTLMGQAGLHIPAFEGSKLAVFEEVYADIGDEQSIEQNLSTFSSHMTNTVSILEKADDRSLVLFDELGAGTDPTEGAALATSILSFLRNMQVRTMATTHYSELKVYALSTEGVENACCEFDVETLRPTYRLLIGIPGKSNAFAISSKLGLPEFIIEDAKKRITEQDVAFEDLLSDLETSRVTIEKEQQEIAAYRAEIEQLKKQTLEKQKQLEERKERMIREANEEARKILQEAKDYADETIRKFNKGMSGKDMENTRGLLREKITAANEKLSYKAQKPSQKQNKPEDFHLGDAVKVLSLGLNGTITSLPNARGDLYVQMGILRSQVNIKDIEKIDEEVITGPNIQRTSSGKIRMSKTSTISPEINLIGKTVDEALSTMDKYLDDAYLAHLSQVRVVHGKGTGALRQAVHKHLKKLKIVKSFRLGEFGEGDAGVTIVEFK
ncbi:MAG: endonuclease MutS2 [Lachnospiraceae bacterium]|jgi:DNA mismatch repair protein MutS2|nr:endonuclease MutS2 [Lachnospiraceae bacterium]